MKKKKVWKWKKREEKPWTFSVWLLVLACMIIPPLGILILFICIDGITSNIDGGFGND